MEKARKICSNTIAHRFANTIIAGTMVCAGGVALIGVIRHQRVVNWKFGWNLTGFDGIIFFYVFPILFLIFLTILLRSRESYKINAALVLVSTVLMCYLAEGGLRIWNILHPPIPTTRDAFFQEIKAAAEKAGQSFDTRTYIEVIHQLRQERKRVLIEVLFLRHLRLKLRLTFTPPDKVPDPPPSYDFALFYKILKMVRDSVDSWNGKLFFVYLPSWNEAKNSTFGDREYQTQVRPQVLDLVERLEIPIIDVSNTFLAQDDPLVMLPFRLPLHYSKKGYRVVAETILQSLEDDGYSNILKNISYYSSTLIR